MASAAPLASRPSSLPPLSAAPVWVAAGLTGLMLIALAREVAHGAVALPADRSIWLALHLGSVVPAVPLGGLLLFGRKGTVRHRLLGRIWATLMMTGALSSFGLHSLLGHLGPIHLLSALTLFAVPYGVRSAMRGDVVRHRRTMMRVYVGLLGAGLFAMVPGRLLGVWLFG